MKSANPAAAAHLHDDVDVLGALVRVAQAHDVLVPVQVVQGVAGTSCI